MVDNSDFLDPDGFSGDIRREEVRLGEAGNFTSLRDKIAAVLRHVDDIRVCKLHDGDVRVMADAVIRELTDAIPPIVATAIQGYAQSELVAMSYHGGSKDAFDLMEKMNREALQIALYATTHEDWNG